MDWVQAPGQALIRVGRLRDQANFLPENTSLSVLQQSANYRFPSLVYFFFFPVFSSGTETSTRSHTGSNLVDYPKDMFLSFFPPDILFFLPVRLSWVDAVCLLGLALKSSMMHESNNSFSTSPEIPCQHLEIWELLHPSVWLWSQRFFIFKVMPVCYDTGKEWSASYLSVVTMISMFIFFFRGGNIWRRGGDMTCWR